MVGVHPDQVTIGPQVRLFTGLVAPALPLEPTCSRPPATAASQAVGCSGRVDHPGNATLRFVIEVVRASST
jgi:hypothetical protein